MYIPTQNRFYECTVRSYLYEIIYADYHLLAIHSVFICLLNENLNESTFFVDVDFRKCFHNGYRLRNIHGCIYWIFDKVVPKIRSIESLKRLDMKIIMIKSFPFQSEYYNWLKPWFQCARQNSAVEMFIAYLMKLKHTLSNSHELKMERIQLLHSAPSIAFPSNNTHWHSMDSFGCHNFHPPHPPFHSMQCTNVI